MPNRTTFEAPLGSPDNALNFVRLLLALLVLLSHTAPIAGERWPSWIAGFGGWAVAGFFVISGYLIAGSRVRSAWWSYSIRRIARIFPAYWVQLLLVTLLFAPLATTLTESTWSLRSAMSYLSENWSTFDLVWAFDGTAFPHYDAWNGSAWTLQYELLAYMGCLILFSIPWCRRHMVTVGAVVLVSATGALLARDALDITTNFFINSMRLGSFFAAGILAYGLRKQLVAARWGIAVAAALTVGLFLLPDGLDVAQLPLAYLVLASGATIPVRIGSVNDLSYGVYIFAFPIQQLVAMLGIRGWVHFGVAAAATLAVAWLSWNYLERPSMDLARRLIGALRRTPTRSAAASI